MRHAFAASAALAALTSAAAPAGAHPIEYGRKDGAANADPAEAAAAVKELKELAGLLAQRDQEISGLIQKANDEAANAGKMSAETKSALEALVEKASALQSRLVELEQKAVARVQTGPAEVKSLGQMAAGSDGFKALREKGLSFRGRAEFEVKATITSSTANAAGSAGALIRPDRLAGVVAAPDRELTVRDLIMPGRTSSNAVEYVEETGFTNGAGMVAEGALKPQSDLQFELKTTNVRTIAHWALVSVQVLADVPMLESYIDGRLRYGLKLVEDTQLLTGDGTGQNLKGLIPSATAFDDARRKAGDTKIDTIRRAMTQVRLAQYRASATLMHPSDWEEIELTKDNTGGYIFANPQGLAGPTLWGRPVVVSDSIDEGEFLVGAFNMAAQLFDREDAVVAVSTEDSDNFRKNLVTIRAEQRLAMAVTRPESLVTGAFDAP